MSRDKKRARSISQAQKQRQREKASAPLSPPALTPSSGNQKRAAAVPRGDGGQPTASPQAANLERKVTVRLDAARYAQLEDYARREGFTVSVIVRHLLCRFLEDQRRGGRLL